MQTAQNIAQDAPVSATAPRVENLPFFVDVARNEADLAKAVTIRQAAYGRHVPELAATLGTPELYDHQPGTAVLLARSKLDDEPLGTLRIQTNLYGPLALEQSIELPGWLGTMRLAEATRLGVGRGRVGRLVKAALFKAYYLYCVQNGIDWMVVTGRAPLDRQYDALCFADLYPGRGYIPMHHVGGIPHRVLSLEVNSVEERWRNGPHPLYEFFFRTRHPDIRLQSDPTMGRNNTGVRPTSETGQPELAF